MRVVIVKTSAMGDVAQALPVAQYLKEKQGVETVGWVVEESVASLVRSYPYVDCVIEVNSKKIRSSFSSFEGFSEWTKQKSRLSEYGEWDVAFDLQGNTKSMLINMCLPAKEKIGYGWKTAPEKMNLLSTSKRVNPPADLCMRDEYMWVVQSHFEDASTIYAPTSTEIKLTQEQQKAVLSELKRWPEQGERPVWLVACGSRWVNKTCTSSTMLKVLEGVYEQIGNIFFVFVAGSYEELKEVGHFASRFLASSVVLYQPELPCLANLIARADRVLAMDSLVLHLASLTSTPTFSFFGPSNSQKYAPQRPVDGYFQGKCPLGYSFSKRCSLLRTCSSGACLREASFQDMLEELILWDERVLKILAGDQNLRTARQDGKPQESSHHLLSVSSQ